jgi:ATP-binding cassette, subfamily B, bacterial IrtA/YbtP
MEKEKPKKLRKSDEYRRLFAYAGRFKYLTYASMLLSAVSAVCALMPFVYIWKIIREALAVMPDFSRMTESVHNGWMAVLWSGMFVVVYFAALMCSHIAAFRIARNIRQKTIRHVVSLPSGSLSSLGSGRIRSIINDSSAATETFLAHQTPDMAGAAVTPFAILVLLFVFDWRFGIASLVPVLLSFACMAPMMGKSLRTGMTNYQNALTEMNNEAVEYVRGIAVVKTFGQTAYSFGRLKDTVGRYSKWTTAYTCALRQPMLFFTLFVNGAFAALIAAAFIINGGIQDIPSSAQLLSNFLFYVVFTPVIAVTLNKILYSSENTMIVEDALTRIDSLLALKPLEEPAVPLHPAAFDVSFDNVSFSYDGTEKPAVQHVSFSLQQGKTIALVGPSGGGKTTLASLLTRFYDVSSGSVKIGGVDVRSMTKDDLMKTVSYVYQDSRLLKTSILENVRMGRPDASREDVTAALEKAQCSDIIAKLPHGIDTVFGSRGVYLSGGECQRVALARTILNDTPVIVLDEATAFADPENEYLMQKAFAALSKNKTVIMIAHRLSTVRHADCIYVLSKGSIVEGGVHEDLLVQHGLYAGMWNEYLQSVDWNIGGKKREDV